MNQGDFAGRLGIGQAALSAIEKGIRNVTDRNILLICEKFNVNEAWLRSGDGGMFTQNDDSILRDLSKRYKFTALDEVFFRTFLQCSPEQRALLKQVAFRLMDTIATDPELLAEYQHTKKDYPIDDTPLATTVEATVKAFNIEQKKKLLLAELEAQEKMQTSSATIGTNGSSVKIG